jgi:[NiFe] hydrogenase diaphorase moiety large subunit
MKKLPAQRVDLIFEKVAVREILEKVLEMKPEDITQSIIDSGLKGRGGAGFPTGLKWQFAAREKESEKYIVCNADEGEPGTFKDRQILDEVSEKVFCGMAIASKATGARIGYIYLRVSINSWFRNWKRS